MPINNQSDEKIVSGIKVKVLKKDIKNFHLNVLPPNGLVRVSVPMDTSDDAIHFFIASRLTWIKKKIDTFKNHSRESKREYLENESHYFLGKRYLLKLLDSPKNYVEIDRKKYLKLYVRDTTDIKLKEKTLQKFYRDELKKIFDKAIPQYEELIGVKVEEYSIRKMKTKWGSCNSENNRVNFNLGLAKKPIKSINYVIVHELVHLIERNHGKNFLYLMDKYMPKWREERQRLNNLILSYEDWE
jgi:hypothetical protein